MSKFNSTVSVVGIDNPKVQQALLKLLENSLHQKELIDKTNDTLSEKIRRLRQQIASADMQPGHGIALKNLSGPTTFNATNAQYRKVATLPAVSSDANAVVTFWGAMGGQTNATLRQIGATIGNRQSGSTYSELDIEAYFCRASMPTMADIVIYKEPDDTFSVYLKGEANAYFRHEVSMAFNEQVTAVSGTFSTAAPTGTLVWSFLANAKRIPTADELANYAAANHTHSNYALSTHNHAGEYAAATHDHAGVYQPAGSYAAANHNHDQAIASAISALKSSANTWSMAQTFSSSITANGKVLATPTSGSWYQGRDLAAFKTDVSTVRYVPILSVKSNTGSWEIGTYTENNELHIAHITDENYSARNNVTSVNIKIGQNGNISGVTSPEANANGTEVPTTAWCRTLFNQINQSGNPNKIELNTDGSLVGHGGYIDFHFNGSSNDYTSRIIEPFSGIIQNIGKVVAPTVNSEPAGYTLPAGYSWVATHDYIRHYCYDVFAKSTVEKIGWSHINVDLDNSTFLMSGIVSDWLATYNLKVTFRNTNATERTCLVNGNEVSLSAGDGKTANYQTTVSGSESFTIDNISTTVDVFIRIWR